MKKKSPKPQEKRPARKATAGKAREKKEGFSLADIIDPMLMAGGKTVKEIAADLAKKAGDAANGKDLQANVRARMISSEKEDRA